jgi:hypothetical protein
MEKKLSEILKHVISDSNITRKFYHDDSIMTSPQAFILCDQLAGLSAIDFRYFDFYRFKNSNFVFSFCFKQDGPMLAPLLLNGLETDVIDLTPFLTFKSRQ